MTDKQKQAKPKSGFGGFLILPLLGFVLTPLKFFFVLYSCVAQPHALSIPLNRTILALDVLSVLATVLIFVLFIQKKRTAPDFYVFYRLLWIIAATAVFIASNNYPLTPASNLELAGDFFGSVIGAIIFVPYFLFSKRVQATFVNGPSAGSLGDAIVGPVAPFFAGFSGFLRKTKLFVILIVLGYAVTVVALSIVSEALL